MENNKVIQQMGSSDEKERNKKRIGLHYITSSMLEMK
jgi:hypothetical protein